jgi:hypothetical protein
MLFKGLGQSQRSGIRLLGRAKFSFLRNVHYTHDVKARVCGSLASQVVDLEHPPALECGWQSLG